MGTPEQIADLTDLNSDFFDPYFWKSEHEVVLLRHVPGPAREDAGHFQVLIHDLAIQQTAPLEAFNTVCAPLLCGSIVYVSTVGESGKDINYMPPHCSLSPDGQWLVGHVYPPRWVAAPLKPTVGQTPLIYALPENYSPEWCRVDGMLPSWLPDNRRWASLVQVYENRQFRCPCAVVHDIEDPAASRVIRVTGISDGLVLGVTAAKRPSGLSGEAILLLSGHLDQEALNEGVDEFDLFAVPLNADTVEAEHWTVSLSKRRECTLSPIVSPDGEQLVWLLRDAQSFDSPGEVWVSKINGEDMRLIASVPTIVEERPDTQSGFQIHFPTFPAWLPTERAVSYRYRDALWKVALD